MRLQGRVEHRESDLDAAVKVARHQIGRSQKVNRFAAVLKVKDTCMFEITINMEITPIRSEISGNPGPQSRDLYATNTKHRWFAERSLNIETGSPGKEMNELGRSPAV